MVVILLKKTLLTLDVYLILSTFGSIFVTWKIGKFDAWKIFSPQGITAVVPSASESWESKAAALDYQPSLSAASVIPKTVDYGHGHGMSLEKQSLQLTVSI